MPNDAITTAVDHLLEAFTLCDEAEKMAMSAIKGLEVPNLGQKVQGANIALAQALDEINVALGTLRRADPEWTSEDWENRGGPAFAQAMHYYYSVIAGVMLSRAETLGGHEHPFERCLRETWQLQAMAMRKAASPVVAPVKKLITPI
jgi:hypothetical protein